jgi:hypothetical protein
LHILLAQEESRHILFTPRRDDSVPLLVFRRHLVIYDTVNALMKQRQYISYENLSGGFAGHKNYKVWYIGEVSTQQPS